jgi:hypothetical protein
MTAAMSREPLLVLPPTTSRQIVAIPSGMPWSTSFLAFLMK